MNQQTLNKAKAWLGSVKGGSKWLSISLGRVEDIQKQTEERTPDMRRLTRETEDLLQLLLDTFPDVPAEGEFLSREDRQTFVRFRDDISKLLELHEFARDGDIADEVFWASWLVVSRGSRECCEVLKQMLHAVTERCDAVTENGGLVKFRHGLAKVRNAAQ